MQIPMAETSDADLANNKTLHSSKGSQNASKSAVFLLFFFILLTGVFICWVYIFMTTRRGPLQIISFSDNVLKKPQPKCTNNSMSTNCTTNYQSSTAACPDHFRWIQDDLRPWKSSGISKEMVEKAKESADFRLVIVNGKIYVEKYNDAFQTRDVFTIWGFLQLLRFYPGKVPDLELMFNCGDRPQIYRNDYRGSNATSLPVMFQYCGTRGAPVVLFPDWSFWGWAEVNIKPWTSMLKGIIEGSKRIKWKDRIPYAYWKGNPNVNYIRSNLMLCNVSKKYDWNARLYMQNWTKETEEGFKYSKLEDQCNYRYKIYVEGYGWSVSEKYIFACDSMVLFVKPKFYDFFTRSMAPMKQYWPIRRKLGKQCVDIRRAVQWGNNHTRKAQEIGKAGSRFIQENLKMNHVYDYMFHVLTEYAKLLQFKPSIPEGGIEVRSETMSRSQTGLWKKFMLDSMVMSPSETLPCTVEGQN